MQPTTAPRFSVTQAVIKNLRSVIHPPLPLTPRQKQTLLRTLQDSFRQHLEPRESDVTSSTPNSPPAPYESPNAHLGSVLKMPFMGDERHQREERLKRYLIEPIAVFEEHVTLGTASIGLAVSCLSRHRSLGDGKERDAGTRVLKGLVTAGVLKMPDEFIVQRYLSTELAATLLLEGRTDFVARSLLKHVESYPFKKMQHVIDMIKKKAGLERATGLFFALFDQLATVEVGVSRSAILGIFGHDLCKAVHEAGCLDREPFNRLLAESSKWVFNSWWYALIQLKYGNNVQPGVEIYTTLSERPPQFWQELSFGTKRLRYAQLGVDVAAKCLERGNLGDALAVAQQVSTYFATEVGECTHQNAGDKAVGGVEIFRRILQDSVREKLIPAL